jgi:dinuclear metal center YbgI/SA1388 family protein
MKIFELIEFLHHIAPISLQEDYDNSGLIIGNPMAEIKGVLICLDALEAVVDEAITIGCNVIVSHHPIIFKGLKKINGSNYIERTIIKAIKNDVAIFAIHTNLDNVLTSGVNGKIAEKLMLTEQSILVPKKNFGPNDSPVGAGLVGKLTRPMPSLEFLNYLKDKMQLEIIKHTALCKDTVQKVALCGGSGSFLLDEAQKQQADIFITADYKYHGYFDADNAIIIADIGHYESEKFTIELLYDLIIKNFSTFATHYTKINTNPIKYFQ